ncbi:unnamed protein product, partial [Ixodes persulcatus]
SAVLAGACQAYKHRGYGLCKLFAKSRWRRMFSTDVGSGSSCSTIAVCQLTSTSDKAANFRACSDLIHRAKSRGAQMVFLPEAMDFVAEKKAQACELAEPLDGPLITKYKSLAKQLSVWLSLGSVHVKDADKQGNKVSNTHVVINSEGDIVDTYSKVHMFDVDVPGARIRESDYTARGSRITRPVATPVGKVGLGIISFKPIFSQSLTPDPHCYDLRFPEFSLSLAKMGADIITYPSAFTVPTGMAHWEVIMRARAIESQCYVVSAAQVGPHNPKRSSYGHALVVDPWGCVVAQCSDAVGIAVAEINLGLVAKVRQAIPVWNHRRTDLYGNLSPCWSASEQGPPEQLQYQFGQVTVQAAHVFYKSPLTIAFVNKMPVLPGRILCDEADNMLVNGV